MTDPSPRRPRRPRRAPLRAVLLAAALVAVVFALMREGVPRIPDRWNPWAPPRLDQPPGLLTRFKLHRLSTDPAACQAVLAQSDFRYVRLPDRRTGEGCGFSNAVRIERMGVALDQPFSLSCRTAVSLALWERHVLQPTARQRLGTSVVRLEHFGSYACRNVANRDKGRRSRHATADALDVAGFVLADGRRIRVLGGWGPASPDVAPAPERPESRWLRDLHAGACGLFSSVLGPGYDAAHRDHLHLDRAPGGGICR